MTGSIALVVAEPVGRTPELDEALRNEGFDVQHATAGELFAAAAHCGAPDVLLVSASLGLERIGKLRHHLAALPGSLTTMVFPDGDFGALESCVQGGFDYVVPPFLPGLLRTRVTSCSERSRLTTTVEQMTAETSLREYERDMSIAHDIQAGFLPDVLPSPTGWEFASRFQPAKQVAGDFYDGFELVNGTRIGFVVADVCDKGVGAALFMALIRTLLRHTAEHTGSWDLMDTDPGVAAARAVDTGIAAPPRLSVGAGPLIQAVVGTNRYLARNHLRQGYFATLFFGVLDPMTGALLYINGGHNPPVLLRADGERALLAPTGPAVGMLPDSSYALGHTTLDSEDTLFVYTDGVTEARDPDGVLFGTERMLTVVEQRTGESAETLLAAMDGALAQHVGSAEQSDDITMLAVRRTGG
ncbi:MAG: SpoIIE family protein phosphatase [Actinomycetota bacterium]|nr:SpoIIE family protein phosphatase [Actinomycetota bacterium]